MLYVRNVERSSRFYREVLGWRQIIGNPSQEGLVAAFSAPSNRTHHELLLIEVGQGAADIARGRRVGLYHFGLKVGDSDDELREVLATLKTAGTPIHGATDHTVTHSLYISDPDGNEIELYIDVPGVNWQENPALIASPIRPLAL